MPGTLLSQKNAWLLHNGNSKKSQFTTTPTEKPAKDTTLPVLQTGKRKPDEILNARIKQLLNSGLITLKAETEIGYSPQPLNETLRKMQKELNL